MVHDRDKKLIFPISEFFTTANDAKSIASDFFDIKLEFIKKIRRCELFQFAPILVTDFSWGLINAVMETFNNCTSAMYLNWCFEIIFKKSESVLIANLMKSIFQLCSVHFLKLIITKVRKIEPINSKENNQKIQNEFIFAFTLLQNSTNIEEFNDNLKHVFNIFNLKYNSTECNESKNIVKRQLHIRNLTVISLNEKQENQEKNPNCINKIQKNHQIMIIDNDFQKNALKIDSPFKEYFDKLIRLHNQEVQAQVTNKDEINFDYCPELFDILREYLYIVPFWTGMMLDYWKTLNPKFKNLISTRLDNNPAENNFRQTKHNLFHDLPVMPSQYTSRMKNRIDALCLEKYKSELEDVQLKKDKHISEETEPWQARKKTRKRGGETFYSSSAIGLFHTKSKKLISI